MLSSLTGFGSAKGRRGTVGVVAEIRTVNHRSLDIHVRVSRDYASMEPAIIQEVRKRLVRGRVDVSVQVAADGETPVAVDTSTVRGYVEAARRLQAEYGLAGTLDVAAVLALPGVVRSRTDEALPDETMQECRDLILSAVGEALDEAVRMRQNEGAALGGEMSRHLAAVEAAAAGIRRAVPVEREASRLRFEERLAQLLPRQGIDPVRVAQEVAILAEKGDISEEVTRLESHIVQFRQLLEDGREAGKRLDFLLQEMQRETNTILAKSDSLELTRLGLAVRADIEKMREQVQNIE